MPPIGAAHSILPPDNASPVHEASRDEFGMFGPAPDFAGPARSMAWWAESPIENADDLQPELQRAVAQSRMANLRWSTR